MGDIIEITTWPKHRHIFYKVNSSAINFEVKAAGNAAIGLAKEAGTKCDYWVVLGYRSYSYIRKHNGTSQSAHTPNIINNNEYRQFWISWTKSGVSLGYKGDLEPIVKYECKEQNIHYFTFSMYRIMSPVHWRFELPPPQIKRPLKSIEGGKLQWIKPEGDDVGKIPADAVCAGYEHEMLFIVKAYIRGSVTPGKYVPSKGAGFISWGGSAHRMTNVEFLCGFDCVWTPTWSDHIPVGAVEGGYSEVDREPLYVGRVKHGGHIIPGKVQPSHKVCYVSYKNEEKAFKNYEILTENKEYSGFCYSSLVPNMDIDIPEIDLERIVDNSEEEEEDIDYVMSGEEEEDDLGMNHVL